MDKSQFFANPIPGANYTSDTKNYPWHRPPEFTDLDSAIEMTFKKLTAEDAALGLLTMMDLGLPVISLVFAYVMSGVGAGKWTPDFAILLAGPVSHIMYLMAQGYGIQANMGLDDQIMPPSKAFFSAKKIDGDNLEQMKKNIPLDIVKQNAGSFMNQAPDDRIATEPAADISAGPDQAPPQDVVPVTGPVNPTAPAPTGMMAPPQPQPQGFM